MRPRIRRADFADPSRPDIGLPGRLLIGNLLVAERPDGSLACHLVPANESPRALAERLAADARFIAVGLAQIYEVKRAAGAGDV